VRDDASGAPPVSSSREKESTLNASADLDRTGTNAEPIAFASQQERHLLVGVRFHVREAIET